MRRFRFIIAIAAVVAAALAAYGVFTAPKPANEASEHFSALRAAADIEIISKEHHSVEHPDNRDAVRQYWFDKLSAMSPDSLRLYSYNAVDSVNGEPFDIANIYCQFDPVIEDPDHPQPAYMLLMAHIDSRYAQKVLQDTVYSYGAADNGYGCATIMESVALALKYRGEWRQGIKVLLTDSEEWKMLGIHNAIENNHEIFDNVGFVINIDARGVKGPALLFETGNNNSKVMDLYEFAKLPYTYTFTSVVYKMMPTFTDYTPLKAEYPGMNFSTIVDINTYHTDLDNFGNISLPSIQHYGAQIEPVAGEYLTNHIYRDVNYLKSDSDNVSFTIPVLGLFNFTKGQYLLFNAITLALFCLIFCFSIITGRIRPVKTLATAGRLLLYALITFAAGTLVAWGIAAIVGAEFSFFGLVRGIQFDEWEYIGAVVLTLLIFAGFYIRKRKRSSDKTSSSAIRKSASSSGATKYCFNILYGIMLLLVVLSAAAYFSVGENFFFAVPLAIACASLLLWRIIHWRGIILAGIVTILLLVISFCYIVAVALTTGAMGAVLMLVFIYAALLVPMIDLYCRKEKTI